MRLREVIVRYGGTPEIYFRLTLVFEHLISLQYNFKALTIVRDTLWDLGFHTIYLTITLS